MKIVRSIICSVFALLSVVTGISQEFPQAEISNGLITAKLYLPDVDNGYYRATRFDWSGVIPSLEHDGHSYFGKWFKNYDPKSHESVMGPVEAFAPIGYEDAKVGEPFLKIGVGTLVKPKEPNYKSFKTYEISNNGKWEVTEKSNEIVFKHILNTQKYAYKYVKRICLPKGKSEMILTHEFTNTGDRTIETQVFNHNFFLIDSMNIGTGYTVKFSFDIKAEGRVKGIGEFAEIVDNEIRFIKNIEDGKQVYIGPITGYDTNTQEYDIAIENQKTGAGVKIHGDRPLSKLIFWSAYKAICPEPYISIKAEPEETVTWKINYTFYNL